MSELAYCKTCGCEFQRENDEKWKKLCFDCWKEQKNASTNNHREMSSNSRLAAENKRLSDDYNRLVKEYDNLLRDHVELETIRLQQAPLSQELIAKLIRLCHPDKHGNSESSNEVTRVLLSMRKKT